MLALHNVAELQRHGLMVTQCWLIVSGIYIWEFVTTLNYEWSVIRGHKRYRWTIWIYSISRLSCLMVVILTMVNLTAHSKINCQAWVTIAYIFASMGCYCLGAVLMMLRIFAIWDRNKVIVAISTVILVTNIGFQLSELAKIRSVWVPIVRICSGMDLKIIKVLCVNALATDVTLLLIMLAGLIRLRLRDRTFIDLAYVLWKQGVIWLLIATAAELPQVLLLFLSVDVALNSMFLLPSIVAIVIAATRMYRDLTFYAPTPMNTTGPDSSIHRKSNRLLTSTKTSSIVHIPSNRLEVTVHRAYEEHPLSQMNGHGSHPSLDAQSADKPPHEPGLDDSAEGPDDKK